MQVQYASLSHHIRVVRAYRQRMQCILSCIFFSCPLVLLTMLPWLALWCYHHKYFVSAFMLLLFYQVLCFACSMSVRVVAVPPPPANPIINSCSEKKKMTIIFILARGESVFCRELLAWLCPDWEAEEGPRKPGVQIGVQLLARTAEHMPFTPHQQWGLCSSPIKTDKKRRKEQASDHAALPPTLRLLWTAWVFRNQTVSPRVAQDMLNGCQPATPLPHSTGPISPHPQPPQNPL